MDLGRVAYKPGWRFVAQDLGATVAVVLEPPPFPDSRTRDPERPDWVPLPTVQVRMTRYLPARAPDEAFVAACWDLVRCMELHEAGEWFLVDGCRPSDPHELPDGRQCL